MIEFERVRMAGGGDGSLELRVGAGELWVVELPRQGQRPDVAGAALGVAAVEAGEVRFCGRSWSACGPAEAERLRQRAGRVFDVRRGPVWLANLDIEENVLLPHTFPGREAVGETVARMRTLGEAFGLAEMPRSRPHVTAVDVTQAAQCVRALMREPLDALVLEVPLRGADGQTVRALGERLREVRGRGCGVMWLTDGSEPRSLVEEQEVTGWVKFGKSEWTDGGAAGEG